MVFLSMEGGNDDVIDSDASNEDTVADNDPTLTDSIDDLASVVEKPGSSSPIRHAQQAGGSLPNLFGPPLSPIPHEQSGLLATFSDKLKRKVDALKRIAATEGDLVEFNDADRDGELDESNERLAWNDGAPWGPLDARRLPVPVVNLSDTESDPDIDFPRKHFGDKRIDPEIDSDYEGGDYEVSLPGGVDIGQRCGRSPNSIDVEIGDSRSLVGTESPQGIPLGAGESQGSSRAHTPLDLSDIDDITGLASLNGKRRVRARGLEELFEIEEQIGVVRNRLELICERQEHQNAVIEHLGRGGISPDRDDMDPINMLLISNDIPKFDGAQGCDPVGWAEDFDTKTCGLPEREKASLFAKKMKGNAAFWFRGQEQDVKLDWDLLIRAFEEKYVQRARNFVNEKTLYDRKMKEGESVDGYILDIRKLCRALNKNEADTISRIIMNAVPKIARYLMEKNPRSIDDLEDLARRAESLYIDKNNETAAAIQAAMSPFVDRMENVAAMSYAANLQGQLTFDDQQPRQNVVRQNADYSGPRQPGGGPPVGGVCWTCGQRGHYSRTCRGGRNMPQRPQMGQTFTCFHCRQPGHTKSRCPSLVNARQPPAAASSRLN